MLIYIPVNEEIWKNRDDYEKLVKYSNLKKKKIEERVRIAELNFCDLGVNFWRTLCFSMEVLLFMKFIFLVLFVSMGMCLDFGLLAMNFHITQLGFRHSPSIPSVVPRVSFLQSWTHWLFWVYLFIYLFIFNFVYSCSNWFDLNFWI